MARKVVYERSGEPAQVVRVVESDEPRAPERGQVLVRVAAFSVHPGDLAGIAGPFAGAAGGALVPGAEAPGRSNACTSTRTPWPSTKRSRTDAHSDSH